MDLGEWTKRDELELKKSICCLNRGSFLMLLGFILKADPLNLETTENKRLPDPRTGERL